MSDSVIHARLLCPPPTPKVCSISCPLSQWCYLTISSSAALCSSCSQSLPASQSFPVSQLFESDGQSIGVSSTASVLPMNIQSLISFRTDWLDLLAVQETLQESSPTPQFKSINSSMLSLLYGPNLTSMNDYWKNYSFDYTDLCQQNNVSAF